MVLPTDDDILTALDETGFRWVAWQRALAHADDTDEVAFFATLELELASDHWRERFRALVARRGWVFDDEVAHEAGPFGLYVLLAA